VQGGVHDHVVEIAIEEERHRLRRLSRRFAGKSCGRQPGSRREQSLVTRPQ
jgi:hypothetical protein